MNKKSNNKRNIVKTLIILLSICVFMILFKTINDLYFNANNSANGTQTVKGNDQTGDSGNTVDVTSSPNASNVSTAPPSPSPSDSPEQILEQQIQQKLSGMTLNEKVLQIFMITPEALTGDQNITVSDASTYNALRTYPVGGLIYFGANIVNPDQLKTMTENTQKYADEIEGMPLFLAIDEEGGTIARIANNSHFEVEKYADMASVGTTKDFEKAHQVGKTIGAYLHEYGFNLDFAPNADVLTNPDNTVIGNRSFGTDGNLVAKMDIEVAKGLSENNVLSCFKHYPGHGATEGDTHSGVAYTNRTLDELKKSELIPFQAAVDKDIPFIMVSHISVPNVIGDYTPSSLSKVMITDILRNQMGYDGIIITDSMSMGAIVNTYSVQAAVIQSILAGADMILMPQDFIAAYQGVLDAVNDGIISEQRINNTMERILRVKLKRIKMP